VPSWHLSSSHTPRNGTALFVLLFRYVFGGAIRTPGINYVNYLMPGAFILTVTASAVTTTGVGFADDLASGAIDRFRSLLIALMTAVGFAAGFRIHTGVLPALGAPGLTNKMWAYLATLASSR
jgi:hypothetical protein